MENVIIISTKKKKENCKRKTGKIDGITKKKKGKQDIQQVLLNV